MIHLVIWRDFLKRTVRAWIEIIKKCFNVFHLPDFINNWRKDILRWSVAVVVGAADLVLVPHSRL